MITRITKADNNIVPEVAKLLNNSLGSGYVSPAHLQFMIIRGDLVCVMVKDNKLIGAATAYVMNDWQVQDIINAWGIWYDAAIEFKSSAILPEYRGQGYGKMLNCYRLGWASQQNIEFGIALSWRSGQNESKHVWSSLGARDMGTIERYWNNVVDEQHPCLRCGPVCNCAATLMEISLRA